MRRQSQWNGGKNQRRGGRELHSLALTGDFNIHTTNKSFWSQWNINCPAAAIGCSLPRFQHEKDIWGSISEPEIEHSTGEAFALVTYLIKMETTSPVKPNHLKEKGGWKKSRASRESCDGLKQWLIWLAEGPPRKAGWQRPCGPLEMAANWWGQMKRGIVYICLHWLNIPGYLYLLLRRNSHMCQFSSTDIIFQTRKLYVEDHPKFWRLRWHAKHCPSTDNMSASSLLILHCLHTLLSFTFCLCPSLFQSMWGGVKLSRQRWLPPHQSAAWGDCFNCFTDGPALHVLKMHTFVMLCVSWKVVQLYKDYSSNKGESFLRRKT